MFASVMRVTSVGLIRDGPFLGFFLQGYRERGTEPQRPGSGHESLCPYEAFDTAGIPCSLHTLGKAPA